jgi:hypothetical protein
MIPITTSMSPLDDGLATAHYVHSNLVQHKLEVPLMPTSEEGLHRNGSFMNPNRIQLPLSQDLV